MYSLLKATKTCQICKRSFSNGKALGGHMRAHTRKLSAGSSSSTGSVTPSLRPCNNLGASFRPPETVLVRSVHTSEVVGGPKPDLNTEGEQQITAKRKIVVVDLEEEDSTESESDITIEESALCLLKMKSDPTEYFQNPKSIDSLVSTRKKKDTEKHIVIDSEDDDQEDSDEYVAEDEDEDEDDEDEDIKFLTSDMGDLTGDSDEDEDDYDDENAYYGGKERRGKKQSKYTCDICGQVLHSYQALGGHRTSHRNKRLKISDKNHSAEDGPVVRRSYECQICNRVFASGQALGGHKKIHYTFHAPPK
ncbi:unnamed protein product [Arabidopsis lyrata]|uniref:zinc finger protein ZAT9 n=1 Tax=Arabidopsis lyrata subsp. lyrata TaxID=81972 RepID=UPI000A29D2A3|nr:zinc finger protein ZAT9 [Arabidopsis lyrata subsp. lyrata]CAH8280447.1 unnamed protein product [Arabidopsis lyrata]|eukprot:XP_020871892.1 zinc finger protein ZAT9 [Arabidopsis lyrata subsp. lyrata]